MLIILFVYGSIIGSFICLCAGRIPAHLSIIHPRSHCDECHHQLCWWQLIPLFGFLIQLGHCHYCKNKISYNSFCLELSCGIVTVFTPRFSLTYAICYLIFYCALAFMSATDLQFHQFYSITLLFLCPASYFLHSYCFWNYKLLIAIVGTALWLLVLSTVSNGLGFGDIELILIFELLIGFHNTMLLICLASLLTIFFIFITKHKGKIAFVPFLSLSFFIITSLCI